MSKTATVKRDEEPLGKPTRCQDVSGSPFTAHNCFLISCGAPLKRKLLQTIKNKRRPCSTMAALTAAWCDSPACTEGVKHELFGWTAVNTESQSHFGKRKKMEEKLFLLGRRVLFIVVWWKSFTHSRSFVLLISTGKQKTRKRVHFAADVFFWGAKITL